MIFQIYIFQHHFLFLFTPLSTKYVLKKFKDKMSWIYNITSSYSKYQANIFSGCIGKVCCHCFLMWEICYPNHGLTQGGIYSGIPKIPYLPKTILDKWSTRWCTIYPLMPKPHFMYWILYWQCQHIQVSGL